MHKSLIADYRADEATVAPHPPQVAKGNNTAALYLLRYLVMNNNRRVNFRIPLKFQFKHSHTHMTGTGTPHHVNSRKAFHKHQIAKY